MVNEAISEIQHIIRFQWNISKWNVKAQVWLCIKQISRQLFGIGLQTTIETTLALVTLRYNLTYYLFDGKYSTLFSDTVLEHWSSTNRKHGISAGDSSI